MNMPLTERPHRDLTVGEIAAALPGATAVFRRYGLDFCCKGNVLLADSACLRGVDVAEVEAALASLDPAAVDTTMPDDTAGLIAHILSRYHEVHRHELPELIELARKVEKVHAERARMPCGLADLLQRLSGELETHMMKEEVMLFPAMAQAPPGMLAAPISCMRHEHEDHGAHLQRLEAITDRFTVPADGCRSWQVLYAGTAKLADDLMQHIHLENNILFPRFSPTTT
ncbi:MAG: iron-sulfur cluster repair di-iron protein [Reyranella sp.]|uniref:iron-sulfur cluster repair di-iron protein n=1 Tax=Reyranella sp. TaxID=1929291 RepID=UPI00273213E5|nr:iron-sulfur cluster repair di-iron protein [Reyranella sp.]MDP1963797.1 iron-sulfur cluster repair di-iron protein [Reyranella sp.]MDP2374741.1 iron-sulfur cluster repair di-iron protein [Reyranella sp.]